MNKQRQDPDIKALARKDVFKKVADGDWYQYAKEPKLQKIVKTSAQRIQKINQLAIEDDEQAMRELKPIVTTCCR